ncbi:MAG: hypothetical protein ACYDBW_06975 [Sulfuricaulis sp.]
MKRRALGLLLLTMPALAQAAGPLIPADEEKSVDFSLRFASARAPFDYGAQNYDTTSRWIGISWRQKTSERLTLGMYGGTAYVTQSNNPVTAGLELDGYHAGFSLHGILYGGRRTTLFYAAYYTYQKVDHKDSTQTVVLDWSDARGQLGAIVTVSRRLRLYGGGNYGYIGGQERVSGTIDRTTDFRRAARAGGFLGLDIKVDTDGYVGVEANTGLARGGQIYFKRSY